MILFMVVSDMINNSQIKINLKLKIQFKTTFHIGSGLSDNKRVDNLVVKEEGFPYIPGSSLKGRIRYQFNKIASTISPDNFNTLHSGSRDYLSCQNQNRICKTEHVRESCLHCRIFGSEFFSGSLYFSPARLKKEVRNKIEKFGGIQKYQQHLYEIRTGNKINRKLQTTEDSSLFNYEMANGQYPFRAEISGQAHMNEEELTFLKRCIELLDFLGGNKSRGLGRCKIEITE